jgi:hypothetical protein
MSEETNRLEERRHLDGPPASAAISRLLKQPHKAAALTYAGLGVLVILLTFVAGLVPEGRENAAVELGIGAFFIVIFAALIYRGWWPVSAVLIFSNSWRAFTYFNDGRGWHIELRPFSATAVDPQPIAFLNALLMVIIVIMLARSAWHGFSTWRKHPPGGSETSGRITTKTE